MDDRARWRVETLVVLALAAGYLLWFRPFQRPVVLDPATWDYMSLALGDGIVPYRDVFLHKTPGALFLGALGAAVGRALGLDPLLGVHAVFLFCGALVPALLYYGCRRAGHEIVTAAAAAAWLLAYDQWSLAAIEGVRPKIATTALGVAALLAARAYPFASGVFGGAAVLCWQPGLVFLAAAAFARWNAAVVRSRTGGRDPVLAIATMIAGSLVPVVALLGYLASVGALADFWRDAVVFNLHYVSINARTPLATAGRLATLLGKWNSLELVLLTPALAGTAWLDRRLPDGIATATLLYAALVFVSVQAWPDTILLGPGIAVTLAVGLSALGRRVVRDVGAVAVLAVALAALAVPRSARFAPPVTLAEQRASFRALAAELSPDDTVFVVSAPEFLIHTARHSVLRWPYMWFGVDRFAAAGEEEGFDGLLARIADADPRLMIVCRRWGGPLRKRFEAWAAARYTRETVKIYPHVARPMAVYRKRE